MQTSDPQYGTAADNTMPKRDSAGKIGLIMGVALFLATLILGFLWAAIGAEGFGGIVNIIAFIAILMATGAIAGRRFASPALAGLVAGITLGLLTTIATAVGFAGAGININQLTQQTGVSQGEAQAALGVGFIIAGIVLALVFGALGALFGWLGGKLFGKGRDATTYRT